MKKSVLLLFAVCVLLTGCSNENKEDKIQTYICSNAGYNSETSGVLFENNTITSTNGYATNWKRELHYALANNEIALELVEENKDLCTTLNEIKGITCEISTDDDIMQITIDVKLGKVDMDALEELGYSSDAYKSGFKIEDYLTIFSDSQCELSE